MMLAATTDSTRGDIMEPGKYDNPEQPLTTTLGTTLGADAIPIETPASDDARRAVRDPVPGEEHFVGRSGPGPKIMAADTLEGDDIVNTAGDKLFAIPWLALRIDPPNHRFILDVDKETLKNAPGFDKDHWPSMADELWAKELHTYYKANPYWD